MLAALVLLRLWLCLVWGCGLGRWLAWRSGLVRLGGLARLARLTRRNSLARLGWLGALVRLGWLRRLARLAAALTWALRLCRRRHSHRDAVAQPVRAVGHHLFAGL